MKKLKINIPEGYEIDSENSTFEEIIFKKLGSKLPISWKEYCEQYPKCEGYCITTKYDAQTSCFEDVRIVHAYTALLRLHKLRDVYRQGWVPNWDENTLKHCIVLDNDYFHIENWYNSAHFLSFQSQKIAEEFLKNFKDLLEEIKLLL